MRLRGLLGGLLLVVLLAACGGNPGTKIVVRADNIAGQVVRPLAVAFQVENSEWTQVWPDKNGNYSFYVPSGKKRYGVAVKCPGMLAMGDWGAGSAYFLTTDESTNPLLPCDTLGALATAQGNADVSAVAGAAGFEVEAPMGSSSNGSTHYHYEVDLSEGPSRDLVLLAFNNSHTFDAGTLIAGRVFRGVNAVGAVNKDLQLAAGDTVTDHNFAAFSVPAGWTGGYRVSLVTAGGALVDEDMIGRGSNGGGSYHAIRGVGGADFYLARASAENGGRSVARMSLIPGDSATDISLAPSIDPFPSGYAPAAAAFPSFALNHPGGDLDGYYFLTFWPYTIWTYTLSKGWIAGQASFAAPDLTGLVGFEGDYPRSGENYMWYAAAFKTSASMQDFLETSHFFFDEEIGLPRIPGMVLDVALTSGNFHTP